MRLISMVGLLKGVFPYTDNVMQQTGRVGKSPSAQRTVTSPWDSECGDVALCHGIGQIAAVSVHHHDLRNQEHRSDEALEDVVDQGGPLALVVGAEELEGPAEDGQGCKADPDGRRCPKVARECVGRK